MNTGVFHDRYLATWPRTTSKYRSRIAVVVWGIALIAVAIGLHAVRGQINLLSLAFGMVTYTYGPLLGAFLLALSPVRRDIRGVLVGTVLSILLVLWVRPDLYNILVHFGALTSAEAEVIRPKLNFAWLYPVTCLITLGCGVLLGRKRTNGGPDCED
jgi:Na+/proline symporter